MTTWSGWSKPYGDSRAMKVGVDAWISSSNDTQAYITVKAMATSGSAGSWEAAYQYGVVTQDGHGAAGNRGADWNEAGRGVLNAGDTIAQGQHTYGPFNRTTSAYSVACWGKAWGETVNGYGAWAGDAEVFVNVTIPALPVYAPNPVTGLSASRASDTRMNLSWTNHPDTTHPYTSILVERQIDNGSWAQIVSIGGGSASHADSTTTAGHVYRYRVRSSNASGTSAYATSGFTYTTPPACSACTNTRVSDTKNTVSWKLGTSVSGLYATIKVERSMDGGSWAEIASVSGSATSYADTGTSSNHAYAYRVRANNAAGYSGYAASSTTYNTPTEPSNVVAARKTETVVTVTMDNPALTATAAEVQRSSDAATWATIRTITSANVTSFDDTPGGGTFYYRVRNTRGSLASAWSAASNKVITIIAPAAPTLNEPASGVVVPKTQQSVHFAWTHNPIDGSPQSKAEIATSTDGGATWTTSVVSDPKTAADLANAWSINATVTWRVRTKGAHADFGAWSSTRAFRVCQMPSVSVSSPAVDGQALTDVPVRVAWTYNDPSGTQQQATVTVKSAEGSVLFTRTIAGATVSLDIGTKDMLPKNNSTFTITVAVVSTSSLASSATRTFTTNYLEPAVPEIIIEQDSINGRVSATCFSGDRDGDNLPTRHRSAYSDATPTGGSCPSWTKWCRVPERSIATRRSTSRFPISPPRIPTTGLRLKKKWLSRFLRADSCSSISTPHPAMPTWPRWPWTWNGTPIGSLTARSSTPRAAKTRSCSTAPPCKRPPKSPAAFGGERTRHRKDGRMHRRWPPLSNDSPKTAASRSFATLMATSSPRISRASFPHLRQTRWSTVSS